MIKLSNITKVFHQGTRTIQALNNVSLHVPAGQIYGVIGASGAGKSTLIRCVNLLERPTEGSVLVGTSTMNNVMMPKIAGLVEEMTGLRFRNKRASAFGSHGWSGGAVDRLSTRLQDAGFEMSLSLKAKWRPDQDALKLCREHGREIARQWALAPLPQSTVNTVVKEETSATTTADLGPRMQCSVCQWIYDPAKGEPMQDVAPGTPWSEVPDNFLCPECSLGKDVFEELASEAK